MDTKNEFDKPKVILSACSISGSSSLIPNIMPFIVAILAINFGFTNTQLGDVSSAIFLGASVTAIGMAFWLKHLNWRHAGGVGAFILVASLFFASFQTSFSLLYLSFFLAGVGAGILYTLATVICGEAKNTNRVFGIKVALETFPSLIVLALSPMLISYKFNYQGIIVILALYTLLLSLPVFLIPSKGVKRESNVPSLTLNQNGKWVILGVLATFFLLLSLRGVWGFAERIGTANLIDKVLIGNALSLGMFLSVFGGFVAAWMGEHFGRTIPVFIGFCMYIAGNLLMAVPETALTYVIGLSLFGLPVNFLIAFILGLTASVGRQGNLFVLTNTAIFLAAMIGPPIFGRVYDHFGYEVMLFVSAASAAISLMLYLFVAKQSRA